MKKNKGDIYQEYHSILRQKIYFNFTDQFMSKRKQPQNLK